MATVWFDGIEELTTLRAELGSAGQAALPAARVAMQKTMQDIVADAKVFAPYEFGTLSESIGYETRANAWSVVGEAGPTVDYGGYQEYGTSRMAPQPYMGPAYDRHVPNLEAALAAIADGFAS